jgi:hypothetical protein
MDEGAAELPEQEIYRGRESLIRGCLHVIEVSLFTFYFLINIRFPTEAGQSLALSGDKAQLEINQVLCSRVQKG